MLQISTYTHDASLRKWRPGNNAGGQTLFKALGHPMACEKGHALVAKLRDYKTLAVFDPGLFSAAEEFDAYFGVSELANIAGVFVQRVERLGTETLGRPVRPVTEIGDVRPDAVLITAFDAMALRHHIAPLIAEGCEVLSLDEMRLSDDWLKDKRTYLNPLNFSTNFAFFRDAGGLHTRVASINYWAGYGAADAALWLCLFDGDGTVLAEWNEQLPTDGGSYAIDSRDVRARFGLDEFSGSLFMHALRPAGHEIMKYVIDTYSEDGTQLSATHDANPFPSALYAGMPAPADGEQLVLWVQNSHPLPIPAGAIGINRMGLDDTARYDEEIPPFGTRPIDVGKLLPEAAWPAQLEIHSGHHFVRPRYEVTRQNGRVRIAHANVERTDLEPDTRLPALGNVLGKGYIMPLPILPLEGFRSMALPTPMTTGQQTLPIKVAVIDAGGETVLEKFLGRIPRSTSVLTDVDALLAKSGRALPSGYGHLEYLYDFQDGGEADGWLHAVGVYEMRASGHRAETSFGAHIYNIPIAYKDEPQSYASQPPGLTTRLLLRIADAETDTLCHLMFPASLPWREESSTTLRLRDGSGAEIAEKTVRIPAGGSLLWRMSEMFSAADREAAAPGGYVEIRDQTCRLFGYHGLLREGMSFSLDHMFGY